MSIVWGRVKQLSWSFGVPIATPSLTNLREHWGTRARRAKQQRRATWAYFCQVCGHRLQPAERAVVTLIRLGREVLDDDNLRSALKSVRDQLAECLGVDDADPRVSWEYSQEQIERGQPPSVRVDIQVTEAAV